MVTVYPLKYGKIHLNRAPREESRFYLRLNQVINDIKMLQIIGYACTGYTRKGDKDPVVRHAQDAMLIFTWRILCGRLWEGYKLLREHGQIINAADLSGEGETPEQGKESLKKVHSYFKGKSLIQKVRDKIGFHNIADIQESAFDLIPATDVMVEYIGDMQGHFFFAGAEFLNRAAITALTEKPTLDEAINAIMHDMLMVSGLFIDIGDRYAAFFCKTYLKKKLKKPLSPHIINGAPELLNQDLRFFCEHTKKSNKPARIQPLPLLACRSARRRR
ncbi:MAG: hypothetical protein AB7G06_01645 [Bdellovibrionales bacterium]